MGVSFTMSKLSMAMVPFIVHISGNHFPLISMNYLSTLIAPDHLLLTIAQNPDPAIHWVVQAFHCSFQSSRLSIILSVHSSIRLEYPYTRGDKKVPGLWLPRSWFYSDWKTIISCCPLSHHYSSIILSILINLSPVTGCWVGSRREEWSQMLYFFFRWLR